MSPATVALAALLGPSEGAFRAYWLVIWALGGLGVLWLARHLRAPVWMACVAAIGYMFSANFTGQAEYTAYLVVMALLPWTLWRLDVALEQRRLLPAAQAGALWGLAALSGYPGLIIIGECYLAGWVLGRWICGFGPADVSASEQPSRGAKAPRGYPVPFSLTRKSGQSPGGRGVGKNLLIVALWAGVSLAAMAPAYFGFLHELRGYSDRSGAIAREGRLGPGARSEGPFQLRQPLRGHRGHAAVASALGHRPGHVEHLSLAAAAGVGTGGAVAAAAAGVSLVAGGHGTVLPGRHAGRPIARARLALRRAAADALLPPCGDVPLLLPVYHGGAGRAGRTRPGRSGRRRGDGPLETAGDRVVDHCRGRPADAGGDLLRGGLQQVGNRRRGAGRRPRVVALGGHGRPGRGGVADGKLRRPSGGGWWCSASWTPCSP